jgi:hypothetical protein
VKAALAATTEAEPAGRAGAADCLMPAAEQEIELLLTSDDEGLAVEAERHRPAQIPVVAYSSPIPFMSTSATGCHLPSRTWVSRASRTSRRPVRVYRVSDIRGGHQIPSAPALPTPPLPLPDKPSVAVLAFQNMSGDGLFRIRIDEQAVRRVGFRRLEPRIEAESRRAIGADKSRPARPC